MSAPKFSEGQMVLVFPIGNAVPEIHTIVRILGFRHAGERTTIDSYATVSDVFYETDVWPAVAERIMRPIIDPDAGRETEQEEDDITA